MPDPNPADRPAQFRSLLRSFALDPGLLSDHLLAAEHLARVVAQEVGKTCDRIFTPAGHPGHLPGPGPLRRSLLPGRRRTAARLAGRPGAAPVLARYRRLLQGTPTPPRDAPAPAGPRDRRSARRAGPRRLALPRPPRHPGRRLDGEHARHPGEPGGVPPARNQKPGCGFPIARIVVLIALATGAVLDAAIGRCTRQADRREHAAARPARAADAGDILLADRYYCSYFEVALLLARGVDVVMRQNEDRPADFRRGRRLGNDDHLVVWAPAAAGIVDGPGGVRRDPRDGDDPRAAGAGRAAGLPDPGADRGDDVCSTPGSSRTTSWRAFTGPDGMWNWTCVRSSRR